jgi:chromosome segregation ATPase
MGAVGALSGAHFIAALGMSAGGAAAVSGMVVIGCKVVQLEKDNKKLQSSNESLRKQQQKQRGAYITSERLSRTQIASLKSDVSSSAAARREQQREIQALTSLLRSTEDKYQELKTEHADLTHKYNKLQRAAELSVETVGRLREEVAQGADEHKRLQSTIAALEANIASCNADRSALQDRCDGLDASVARLRSEHERAESERAVERADNATERADMMARMEAMDAFMRRIQGAQQQQHQQQYAEAAAANASAAAAAAAAQA